MITELGHYALMLALFVSLAQGTVPLAGAARRDPAWMGVAQPAAIAAFLLILLALASLMHAYIVSDFSVANVAQNSHTDKPLLYKITGVWGNHEGSMVLWVFMLSLCAAAVAVFGDNLPPALRARVLAVQGLIATGFLLFILFTSNPFLRTFPAPLNGQGLNPVLQDPGLAFHPPFLYLGYVGFSVAFAFAVAALIEGRVDAAWARWVRPWTLASWCALTVGIAMGSWWAYYTLGWGGWWFWDPVENASLMPWLAGTALIHSSIVVEKRDTLKSWTILLAILTFSLSLVGTFLVRSGVLTSVHAFATDPARGMFILGLLIVAIGGSLTLYAVRAPALKGGGLFAPLSREGSLVLNNLLLTCGCATVFLGTLYPLFSDAMGGPKLSVGFPFFNATFVPMMVPLVLAVGIGPLMAWKRGDLWGALQRLWAAALGSALLVLFLFWRLDGGPVLALFGLGLALWLALSVLTEIAERIALFRIPLSDSLRRAVRLPRAAYGMSLAHLGLAISVAGFAASAFDREAIEVLKPGASMTLAGYELRLEKVERIAGPNYTADDATIGVSRNGVPWREMHPERRFFPLQKQTTGVTAIHSSPIADLYLALGEADAKGDWTVRAYWKPLVSWIWAGGLVMAFGGVVSLSDPALARWHRRPSLPRRPSRARGRIEDAPAGLPVADGGVPGAGAVLRGGAAAGIRSACAALGDAGQAGAGLRAARPERRSRPVARGVGGTAGGDQLLRLVVRAVPGRASRADAPVARRTGAAAWHRLQGQARGRRPASGPGRRSLPVDRDGPGRRGGAGFRRLRRAGDVCARWRRRHSGALRRAAERGHRRARTRSAAEATGRVVRSSSRTIARRKKDGTPRPAALDQDTVVQAALDQDALDQERPSPPDLIPRYLNGPQVADTKGQRP